MNTLSNIKIILKMDHMVSLYRRLIQNKNLELKDIFKDDIIKQIKYLEYIIWCIVTDDIRTIARKQAIKEFLKENGYPEDTNLFNSII